MATYRAPKGTKDVLPEESYRWQALEELIRNIVAKYGLREIRTPVIEHTELFLRSVGSTTDVVQKEMYTFLDKGERSITLRPEGTAGCIRMFVENSLYSEAQPTKMYYLNSPVFRYERPQAGRLREHHQFGVEILGSSDAATDAEVIAIATEIYSAIGLSNLTVKLNSIGCPKCRNKYQAALKEYFAEQLDKLCPTCQTRFETNPLRLLDCKVPECKQLALNAPHTMDYVCDDCKKHMDKLKGYLDIMGIEYELDPLLVRGLDYYTKTVFEIVSEMGGAQGTLCGGGRYDGLVKELGGPDMPAVGFGMGLERALLLMEQRGIEQKPPVRFDIILLSMDDQSKLKAFELAFGLRSLGLKADCDHMARSLKAQMKYADKLGATYTLVLGQNELINNKAILKRMGDGTQGEVELNSQDIFNAITNGGRQ